MINAENVTVTFRKGLLQKKIVALDQFSLQVNSGDIYALLGPNGAGKSTAMYCFLGLIKPNLGKVTVLNQTPELGSKLFDKIAYLPEEPHYHQYFTVKEAIRYYNALYWEPASQSVIDSAIDQVGLTDYKDLRISKCSKGMKQKVGIAVCLLKRPELMFLDEPTRGLDPLMVKEFRDILLELNHLGTTIVLNSHMLSEIELMCNRVAIVNKGKVVLQDNLKNLMQYDTDYYSIEFEITESIPEYIGQPIKTAKSITGKIPINKSAEFFKFAEEKQIQVYECSLKRLSLEDVFLEVLKGK